jgi:hypothetical protein
MNVLVCPVRSSFDWSNLNTAHKPLKYSFGPDARKEGEDDLNPLPVGGEDANAEDKNGN